MKKDGGTGKRERGGGLGPVGFWISSRAGVGWTTGQGTRVSALRSQLSGVGCWAVRLPGSQAEERGLMPPVEQGEVEVDLEGVDVVKIRLSELSHHEDHGDGGF